MIKSCTTSFRLARKLGLSRRDNSWYFVGTMFALSLFLACPPSRHFAPRPHTLPWFNCTLFFFVPLPSGSWFSPRLVAVLCSLFFFLLFRSTLYLFSSSSHRVVSFPCYRVLHCVLVECFSPGPFHVPQRKYTETSRIRWPVCQWQEETSHSCAGPDVSRLFLADESAKSLCNA